MVYRATGSLGYGANGTNRTNGLWGYRTNGLWGYGAYGAVGDAAPLRSLVFGALTCATGVPMGPMGYGANGVPGLWGYGVNGVPGLWGYGVNGTNGL